MRAQLKREGATQNAFVRPCQIDGASMSRQRVRHVIHHEIGITVFSDVIPDCRREIDEIITLVCLLITVRARLFFSFLACVWKDQQRLSLPVLNPQVPASPGFGRWEGF